MVDAFLAFVESGARAYAAVKFDIEQSIPFDADWLHLLIGPVIFVLAALALRRPRSALGPWVVVVVLGLLNECIDLADGIIDHAGSEAELREALTDFLLTIAIPTALLLVAHFRPDTYARLRLSRPG